MRNHSIDILKFVFAVIVVIGHGGIPDAPKYLVPIRFAMFCFFMISGYLIEKPDIAKTNESIKKSIIHLIKIFFYCFLIFFPAYLFILFYFNKVDDFFDDWNFFNICVFNETPFWMHFWYLSAYFYLLIIMYFFNKIPYRNTLIYLLPLLLIVAIILGPYSDFILGRKFDIITYRNAWFMGLPSFCMGAIIKRTQPFKKISSNILFAILIITAFLPYLESRVLQSYDEEFYFSNILFAVFLLLAVLKHPLTHPNFLSNLGVNYSMELYILHPLFLYFIRKFIWLHYGSTVLSIYVYFEAPFIILVTLLVLKLWHKVREHYYF